ncbi:hypothetical protein AtubIFM57258_010048 [Aspergillus tubingensis]|nr:hypothetical protein AtubIFM57258_010048 [Aspergillus tubingensis]
MASSSPRLVIGIDIGASKTVVSYGRNDEGTQNIDFFRLHNKYIVPTAIAYTSEDSYEIGEDAQAAGTNCVYWLKHMFDESRIVKDSNDKLIGEIVQSACNQLPQRQKNQPSLVVSDFLRGILGSVRATLNSDTTLLNLPWDFVFTHPSTWSENSFQKLKQAVYSAGFAESEGPRINFITEAEAAAVFAANEQASAMTPFNYVSI